MLHLQKTVYLSEVFFNQYSNTTSVTNVFLINKRSAKLIFKSVECYKYEVKMVFVVEYYVIIERYAQFE